MVYKGPRCYNHAHLFFFPFYHNLYPTTKIYVISTFKIDPKFYHSNPTTTSTKKEKKIILIVHINLQPLSDRDPTEMGSQVRDVLHMRTRYL